MERSNILANIGSLQRLIERHSKSESFKNVLENLVSSYSYMEEAENEVAKLAQNSERGNLDEVETRLFEIRALARKYNISADELPVYYEKSQQELEKLESRIENLEDLQSQMENLKKAYINAATELSAMRKAAAKLLETRIAEELTPLRMAGCKWMVEFAEKDDKNYTSNGTDIVRFVATTNPGMPSGPIDKIASGGELARLMLAVKVALFDKFSKPTIIFDEIDTGIGGSVADAIGDRLKALSEVAQVIVITHQPQVVAKSNFHILVEKRSKDGQTSSSARMLDIDGKKGEIARMLVETFQKPRPEQSDENLSSRELEILTMVAKGMTNKEIAGRLNLSLHTVSNHVRHIYEKLHVHCRAEAVRKSINLEKQSYVPHQASR